MFTEPEAVAPLTRLAGDFTVKKPANSRKLFPALNKQEASALLFVAVSPLDECEAEAQGYGLTPLPSLIPSNVVRQQHGMCGHRSLSVSDQVPMAINQLGAGSGLVVFKLVSAPNNAIFFGCIICSSVRIRGNEAASRGQIVIGT